ncbi:MAG: hypothetical protein JNK63_01760 [Chthonomonas sp.]|nr:hypothetical protein [Chthonomonas sp.]
MRKLSIVIMVVAMLALVLGAVPTSAIASQDMPKCDMACCQVEVQPEPESDSCESTCAEKSKPKAPRIGEKSQDDCNCTMSNSPREDSPVVLNKIIDTSVKPVAHATLPLGPITLASSAPQAEAIVFGSDSSPPSSPDHSPSLGRAPPVRFA